MRVSSGTRILLGLVAGFCAGALVAGAPASGPAQALATIEPLGGMWLSALRMTVLPLVFALLVTGVGTVRDSAAGGRIAARSMVWFVVLLTAAAASAALMTPLLLGWFPVDPAAAAALRASAGHAAQAITPPPAFGDWLQALISANPFEAAAKGQVLQVVIFALLFGFAAARVTAEAREPLLRFFNGVVEVMLVIVRWVLFVAPVGVFALAAALGRQGGFVVAGALGQYLLVVCWAAIFVTLACYPLVKFGAGVPLLRFAKAALAVQILGFSTQSSLACLSAMIDAAQRQLRLPAQVSAVTLPMAVSLFRLTSPIVNLSVVLFTAHIHGVHLGLAQLIAGIAVATITNFAIVGLPSQITFFTTTVPISYAMGVPTDILPLLLAIEVIPDLFRTVGNVTGDLAVTALTARGVGESLSVTPKS